jgi:GDP-L-fucose synthase
LDNQAKIYVAGGETLIGAALLRQLNREGYYQLVGQGKTAPDLTDSTQVEAFFATALPDYVFLAAGKSGGIAANQNYPAELMMDNLLSASHVIQSAFRHRAKKITLPGQFMQLSKALSATHADRVSTHRSFGRNQ